MNPSEPAFPGTAGEHERGNCTSHTGPDGALIFRTHNQGVSTLVYLIAHAPPCPIGHLEHELPAQRQARWRLEYAEAQLAAINAREERTK